MAGYVRQDVTNEIDNGKIIDAATFDAEYDAIEAAFNTTTGHAHDGSPAEGPPIVVVGPAQDFMAGASGFAPKADNTYDLGSLSNGWRDAYIKRNLNVSGEVEASSVGSTLIVEILKAVYPVTSLYFSGSSTNPATSLGFGTWVAEAQGRAVVGVGSNGESTWTAGQERGSETHTLTATQLPAHTHTSGSLGGTTVAAGGHAHGPGSLVGGTTSNGDHAHAAGGLGGTALYVGDHAHGPGNLQGNSGGMSTNASHQHRVFDQTGPSGGSSNGGFNNERYCDVTIAENTGGFKNTDSTDINHTHFVQMTGGATSGGGGHTHALSIVGSTASSGHGHSIAVNGGATASVADHTHAFAVTSGTTDSTGGGGAHNNIQPSIGVYVWRRTA